MWRRSVQRHQLGSAVNPLEPVEHRAYEVIVEGAGDSPIVLCCEHASNALPSAYEWGEDRWLQNTHWAWDPGAAEVVRELARHYEARAVLANFSRLVIDPNRPLFSQTLFRDRAEGRVVHLNDGISDIERGRRVLDWWKPYHDALDAVTGALPAKVLVSMHSFTPVYEGDVREVEIGVLFDQSEAFAMEVMRSMATTGFEVRANEPYSGRGGMMFSCYQHAADHGLEALELELRQDLLADPSTRDRIVKAIITALDDVLG